jgi:hypothetical protein
MTRTPRRIIVLAVLAIGIALPAGAQERKAPATTPKLVSVAETKLIMEGLTLPNYRGLAEHVDKKPANVEGWTVVRGQALLIAESGNLLMLRPPKNQQGQDAWMRHATDLREAGTDVARQAANRDLDKTRAALGALTNTCNRCHQTFQVPVRIGAPDEDRKAEGRAGE